MNVDSYNKVTTNFKILKWKKNPTNKYGYDSKNIIFESNDALLYN